MPPKTPTTWTIRTVLNWTRQAFAEQGFESPRLEAELLIAHALDLKRLDLYLQHDRPLGSDERGAIRQLVVRRSKGEPTAYILGQREFMSLAFEVQPGVLVPRPETELLVEISLDHLPAGGRFLDIGTGSGCIAISVAHYAKVPITTIGTDVSERALEVAQRNAAHHGHEAIDLRLGDLYQPVEEEEPFDVIASNPPYIGSAVIAGLRPEVARFEPQRALDGGADGLEVIRRLIAGAPKHLKPGGILCFEIGYDQADAVRALVEESELNLIEIRRDLAGHPRAAVARWGEAPAKSESDSGSDSDSASDPGSGSASDPDPDRV